MEAVIHAVERICAIEGAEVYVDVGFRQGRDAVFAQMQLRSELIDDIAEADEYINYMRADVQELQAGVAPHALPDDYRFFLEYYAGLRAFGPAEDYTLSVLGFGPMTHNWYGAVSLDSDSGLFENGFLRIALLVLYEEPPDYESRYVDFFLDLAGTIQQNGVIGMLLRAADGLGTSDVLRDPFAHRSKWVLVAPSFTEWLEKAAETAGSLGFRSQDVPGGDD